MLNVCCGAWKRDKTVDSVGPLPHWVVSLVKHQIVEFDEIDEYFGKLRDSELIEDGTTTRSEQVHQRVLALP